MMDSKVFVPTYLIDFHWNGMNFQVRLDQKLLIYRELVSLCEFGKARPSRERNWKRLHGLQALGKKK